MREGEMDKVISEEIIIQIKNSFLKHTIQKLSFIDATDQSLTIMISKYTKVKLYLFQDIIEKELESTKNFYYVQEGCVEAIKEEEDFMYFEISLVKAFLKNDYKYFKKKAIKLN